MATKIIKFNDGTYTYAPVTVANAVQYSYDGGVMSVQDAIGTLAKASLPLGDHLPKTVNLTYTSGSGLGLSGVHADDTKVKIDSGTGIKIESISGGIKISNTQTSNVVQYLTGSGTALSSATHSSVAYVNLDSNHGKVGIQGTAGTSAVNKVGQAEVIIAYDTSSWYPNNIRIKVSYRDSNTNYYDKIVDKGLSGYQIAAITATGTGSSSALYVPKATTSHLGVVQLGYTDTNNTNKGYALKLDSNGKGYVNVPWTDTVPDYSSTYAPYSHTHGNITNDGKISNGASKVVVTDSSGKIGVSTNITTTELECLNNVSSNIQSQIDNINTTISSGMHMRGTTTTVPATNVAYVIGDSYVYAPSTATATITIPAAQSQSAQDEVVGKGDMITYVATGKWAVIQNNIGDYVSSITVTDDNTWIQATPTTSASGAVTIDIQHIGPGTGSTKNATKGTDGSQLTHNSSMVMTGVNWKADGKGHVTEISYTLAKLPAETQLSRTGTNKTATLTHGGTFTYISNLNVSNHAITYDYTTATLPSQDHTKSGTITAGKLTYWNGTTTHTAVTNSYGNSSTKYAYVDAGVLKEGTLPTFTNSNDFAAITAGTDSTDVTAGTVNTSTATADAVGDTLTVQGGNKWITTGTSDTSNADKLFINHALKGNDGTAALKKIAWDEAGHIGASADVTITKNLKYDLYPSDVDFTLPIGTAESTGNTIVTNIS